MVQKNESVENREWLIHVAVKKFMMFKTGLSYTLYTRSMKKFEGMEAISSFLFKEHFIQGEEKTYYSKAQHRAMKSVVW